MMNLKKGSTISALIHDTAKQIKKAYGKCLIVFDGYPETPTKKDMAHRKRNSNQRRIEISQNSIVSVTKEEFFSHGKNKTSLVCLFKSELEKENITVICAEEDADLIICQTAINSAASSNTVVVPEDTDIIVLLWSQIHSESHSLRVTNVLGDRCWDINALVRGEGCQDEICLIHAFLGCDQTSRLHGIGKNRILQSVELKDLAKEVSSVFNAPNSSKQQVEDAGKKLHLAVMKSKDVSLDKLRERVFMSRVGKCQKIKAEQLPPTEDSARQHYFRVYGQVQEWRGSTIDPTEWGWRKEGRTLLCMLL